LSDDQGQLFGKAKMNGRRLPRIAIVSDPLVQRGGAEKIVSDVLAQIFPQAPIFAILYSASSGPAHIAHRVIPTWLQRIPGAARRHRWLLPLYPAAIESIDLRGFDLIISSHHTAAKGILRSSEQRHICYCHTPMRALWERTAEELEELPRALRPLAARSLSRLREWDYLTAARVDMFLANSTTTRDRIDRHYGRDSRIVFPAIDLERFTAGQSDSVGDYYLVASRLVPYKRVDLAIAAAQKLERRLIIVGTGPAKPDVQNPWVEYLGHVSDARLVALMRNCRALLFPALEDFGMTPVEVMACGRPVIAFGRGGALDTVIDGVTGVLAEEQTVDSFADAILRFESLTFDPQRISLHAENFSFGRFVQSLNEAISDLVQNWRGFSVPTLQPDRRSRVLSAQTVTGRQC
jgi:glycosyltransferase involved in cell wall biosynthesis